jgi:hypothetical protein
MKREQLQSTPGPWRWEVNPTGYDARLIAERPRHLIVMDFVRWGMARAAPRFRTADCLLSRVEEFSEVVPGREHHARWYRQLVHPDALLIAAAPDLLAACHAAFASAAPNEREHPAMFAAWILLHDAIAKATTVPNAARKQRTDTERLDWLEQEAGEAAIVSGNAEQGFYVSTGILYTKDLRPTLREAIDAAMDAAPNAVPNVALQPQQPTPGNW